MSDWNIDLDTVPHHHVQEEIVNVLCARTENVDRGFFRVETVYFMGKMASSQRAQIVTKDRGILPVNIYAILLGISGYGKGHSVHVMEENLLGGFFKRFTQDTFPLISEQSLWGIANNIAITNQTDPQEEFNKVEAMWKNAGAALFTFDGGTTPAVKQLRSKLLMSGIGAINLQIDEIGLNFVKELEVLTAFLELYDQGKIKQKLVKNTNDNVRFDEIDGKTPTNALLFGTPEMLLDGGPTEDSFFSMLQTGYARRSLFGYGIQKKTTAKLTPTEVYNNLINPQNDAIMTKWSTQFEMLADPAMHNWKMVVEDAVGIQLLTYKLHCEELADLLPDHEEVRKTELRHRYFRAIKVAGCYAFVDKSPEIEMDHLLSAIKLVEESGEAFRQILQREKPYVKLAKYLGSVETDVTHTDLMEALPFYKSGKSQRDEMMNHAMSWGYKQHIIIKKMFTDGIEFFRGKKLPQTDIEKLRFAYGPHEAFEYQNVEAGFDELHLLATTPGLHWTNHHFIGGANGKGHRIDEKAILGFNMIVLDLDGGISLQTVHEIMADWKFMTYTTKRHTDEENRFRLIVPMNYTLEMNQEEYREFMNSIMDWLPFVSDEGANQRARKWESFAGGSYHYNTEGELFDVLNFIPKTSRNEQHQQEMKKLGNLDNLERWFADRIAQGNRSNQMIKFALALKDAGFPFEEAADKVHAFNKKLSNALSEGEIENTILVTLRKRYQS